MTPEQLLVELERRATRLSGREALALAKARQPRLSGAEAMAMLDQRTRARNEHRLRMLELRARSV